MYILMQNNIKFLKKLQSNNDFTKNKNIIKKEIKSFINDEYGQGLVEYALLITMIAIALCVAVHDYCNKLKGAYEHISSMLDTY